MSRWVILIVVGGCHAPCEGFFADADGDGYGDPATPLSDCPDDLSGTVSNPTDCDDANASAYPGADEIYYDGIDQDCAGLVDEWDQDLDGYTVASSPAPSEFFDCDDTDPSIHPGAVLNEDASVDSVPTLANSDDPWVVDGGPELRLSPDHELVQHHHPTVTLGGDDSFLLAWQIGFHESAEVFTQRFDLNGVALGNEVQLNDLADTGGKPDVESDGDGYWATWQDNRGSIFLRRLSTEGIPIGASAIVYQSAYAAEGPDLALRPDGSAVVVWNVDDIPGEDGRDYYRIYDPDLNPITEPIVAAITGRSVADVAPLPDGSIVLVGTNKDSPPTDLLSEVYGRVIGPDHCVTPFRVDQGATANPSRPAVAASSDGVFAVTWRNKVSRDEGDGVFARLFDESGHALTSQFTLMPLPNDGNRPVLQFVGSDLFFSWQATQSEPGSDTLTSAIEWHLLSTHAPPSTQNIDNTVHHEKPVIDVAADGDGRVMVVAWEAARPTGRVILGRVSHFYR